MKYGYGALVKW